MSIKRRLARLEELSGAKCPRCGRNRGERRSRDLADERRAFAALPVEEREERKRKYLAEVEAAKTAQLSPAADEDMGWFRSLPVAEKIESLCGSSWPPPGSPSSKKLGDVCTCS